MKLYIIPEMSIKQKLLNVISSQPKLTTFVLRLAITAAAGIVVGTAIGIFDQNVAYAAQDIDQSETND